jgi:hypothetical protein
MEVYFKQGHKELAVGQLSQKLLWRVVGWRLLFSEIVKRARRCPMYSRQVRLRQTAARLMAMR